MTGPNEALEPRALHERMGRLTDRLKERFEEFEKRIGKLEEGMREIGEMASKLGEAGSLLEKALPTIQAMGGRMGHLEGLVTDIMRMHTEQGEATLAALGALSARMDLMDKCPSAPDEGLRLTEVAVGDGTIEAGPTVPVVERTFRCLSCGQQSPHTKVDIPVEGSWKCKYCGGTTYYSGEKKD